MTLELFIGGIYIIMAIALFVWFIVRLVRLRSFFCAVGFHTWERKYYESEDGLCIICKKCHVADYSLGV